MVRPGIDLHAKEEIIGMIRRSPWMYAWSFFIGISWTILPLILFFPLIRLGWFGIALLVIGIFSGLWYVLGVWRRWHETMLLITNERIVDIDRTHWRRHIIHEWPVDGIISTDIESEGVIGRLLRLKTLHILMKNPKLRIECHGIKRAEHVKQLLDEVKSL